MERTKIHSLKCFEVSPSFLKGQIKTFNPFERIFKNFLFGEEILREKDYNEEYYDKMVENYYIYKNQFKKYGLTFNVNKECGENGEKYSYLNKIFFINEKYNEKEVEFKVNGEKKIRLQKNNFIKRQKKVEYKGKEYCLLYDFLIDDNYEEKDNKVYFEIDYIYPDEKDIIDYINSQKDIIDIYDSENDEKIVTDYDNTNKFELEIITLEQQYQQNIKPGDDDLLYFESKKLGKSFESIYKELSERELINYRRIIEIPFLFDFEKSMLKDTEPKPDLNDLDNFDKYWNKLVKKAPLKSVDKNDFITMLNIMYEDQFLNHFKEKLNYSEIDDYLMTEDEYLKSHNGFKGEIDAKDVKNFENIKNERFRKNFEDLGINIENFKNIGFGIGNLKEGLMGKEYPFIETKNVIYKLCGRESDSYREYLIYDPVNNFCSFYPNEKILDNYIYGKK